MATLLLHCAECRQSFAFTDGEQAFYSRRGLDERPRRCPACRARKKRSERARYGVRSAADTVAAATPRPQPVVEKPSSTYRASCATCGAPAEVSFRPAIGRPVYCRECYTARQSRGSAYGARGPAGSGGQPPA